MNSKYQRWYNDIVLRGKTRVLDCYRERHHILPRSLGGDDYEENIVDLTYREHFLVHWLLTKIYEGQARRAMVYALHEPERDLVKRCRRPLPPRRGVRAALGPI
jgi:hypothetical protein